MLYVDSVTTFSYYVRQLRAAATGLTDNNKIVGVFDDRPSRRRQGDGYITAWYQVSIKTLKLPRHGRFNARRSSDARSSLAPLSRVPLSDEARGGGPEHTWTASARSYMCVRNAFFFSDGDLIPSSGYDVNRLLS